MRRIEDRQQFLFEQPLEFFHVLDLLAVCFFSQLAQDFLRCGRAQVSADQSGFQLIQRIAVDLFCECDNFFNPLGEVLARARDRLLHAV